MLGATAIGAAVFVFHTYEYQNYRIFQIFLRKRFMYILLHSDETIPYDNSRVLKLSVMYNVQNLFKSCLNYVYYTLINLWVDF